MEKLNIPNLSVLGQENDHLFKENQPTATQQVLPPALANHPAFSQIFQPKNFSIILKRM